MRDAPHIHVRAMGQNVKVELHDCYLLSPIGRMAAPQVMLALEF